MVGGLEPVLFSIYIYIYILVTIIIPTDKLIFFRGVAQPPTQERLGGYTEDTSVGVARPKPSGGVWTAGWDVIAEQGPLLAVLRVDSYLYIYIYIHTPLFIIIVMYRIVKE